MAKKKKKVEIIEKPKNLDAQTKMVFLFMALIILIMIFTYIVVKENKKFNYLGIEFTKEKSGTVFSYLAKFPLGGDRYLSFYFREDPRELENINITEPIFLGTRVALATDSSFVGECSDSILSATTLAVYLKQLGRDSFGATTNKTDASLYNRTYVACNDSSATVVIFREGDSDIITKENECYVIQSHDCNVMATTERFMVGVWASSKGVQL